MLKISLYYFLITRSWIKFSQHQIYPRCFLLKRSAIYLQKRFIFSYKNVSIIYLVYVFKVDNLCDLRDYLVLILLKNPVRGYCSPFLFHMNYVKYYHTLCKRVFISTVAILPWSIFYQNHNMVKFCLVLHVISFRFILDTRIFPCCFSWEYSKLTLKM